MKSGANNLLLIGFIAVLFLAFGGSQMAQPRGIRNNNPGNIRGSGDNWQGATGFDDLGFVVFESPVYGVRAMARVINNYREKYFLVTIRQIVERWAPDSENNTEAYIQSVAGHSGVDADAYIEPESLPAIMAAMIYHENGQQPYSMALIQEGIALA